MKDNDPAIADLYARLFDALNEDDGSTDQRQRRAEFAFHMSDTVTDIEELHRLASDPTRVDVDATASKFYGLMFHLLPHLRAAFRALDEQDCPDVFAGVQCSAPVGATA